MTALAQDVPQPPRAPQPAQAPQVPGEPGVVHVPDRIDPNLVFNRSPDFPFEAMVVSVVFFVMLALTAIGWPIARAIARRMDRKTFAAREDADIRARLERIEQAVEAVAIEIERISEGQRFTTKLLADAGLADRQRLPVGRLPERAP